jgi:hypothetical protein
MSEYNKDKKNYFTKETEDAIILYNNTSDEKIRNEIYKNHIHYAFFKLTENIIHSFKFYYTEMENIEDLQHEVVIFLLSKINKFNPDRGAKAYSYFGTIAKRYLIINNRKNYNKQINLISINNNLGVQNKEKIEEKVVINSINSTYIEPESEIDINDPLSSIYTPGDRLSIFTDLWINYCYNNIEKIFPKSKDAYIAGAILELFSNRENIDIFNKKAIYIYIKEIIDVKAPKITKISNILKKIFKDKYIFYLENGYFKN